MRYYFILQFRRMERLLAEAGVHSKIGWALVALLFVGLSQYLFEKMSFGAAWVYVFLGATFVLNLGERGRNEQLKTIFAKKQYVLIRFLENGLLAIPFSLFLLYQQQYVAAGVMLAGALATAGGSWSVGGSFVLPTPFKRRPFEFTVGFRKTAIFLLFPPFLALKALEAGNTTLLLFAHALTLLIGVTYYVKPEHKYFVWVHSVGSRAFLWKKMANAVACATLLSLPLALFVLGCHPELWAVLAGIQFAGYVLFGFMILAKYSAFPQEISVAQAVMFGLCFWFPPAVLIVAPLFYRQSLRKLGPILE